MTGWYSEVPCYSITMAHPKHEIRVFGQTKTGQVGHLSEQRHVLSVMLLCSYQSSTIRNELMSAQTALKTDQSVHCSDTRPTMLLFLFCALRDTHACTHSTVVFLHRASLANCSWYWVWVGICSIELPTRLQESG